MTTEVLTVAEVAKLLHVSRNHVYELIAFGKLRSLRMGRAIRVPRTALDAFIRQVPEQVEPPDVRRETADADALAEASRHLRAVNAETYIKALVDGFPPLTAEQRERLRELLRPSLGARCSARTSGLPPLPHFRESPNASGMITVAGRADPARSLG